MLPKIVSPSELRKNLSTFLDLAENQLIVIKDKDSNKVIMGEEEYNRLSALAEQFSLEDPEGKYQAKFEKKLLSRTKNKKVSHITSLKDLI